ncbi:AMP-binding protein [Trichocoleus desertorum AS-A10]|uniref:AMP-dependent synthetase/ligase n=1 Tax=Trichocoleus desertorum TaxID=1481672 RepID=UPI003298AE96
MNPPNAPSLHLTEPERANLKRLVDYQAVESLPAIWPIVAQKFGSIVALKDPHAKPEVSLTYAQVYQQMQHFAAGLQALGVEVGDRVGLISDNSPRWFVADQGIMTAGAANAVRSSQADREELLFILADSGSTALVVENQATLKKLRSGLDGLAVRTVVLLSDEEPPVDETLKVLNFSQLLELGANHSLQPVQQNRETLATLIYTSGTTGRPKGAMLSHGNLLHQATMLGAVVPPQPGNIVLSILPSWHAYERAFEYFVLAQGCTQVYTSIRHVKQDLKTYKPQYMVGVPRLWESIYEGVQKQFREQPASKQRLINSFLAASQKYIAAQRIIQGLSLEHPHPSAVERLAAAAKAAALAPVHALGDRLVYRQVREATGGKIEFLVSGGGSFAKHLDNFFEIIGVTVLQGYGLTETSPVTNVRRPWRNLKGASGQPVPGTEIRIVDPETRKPLPAGKRGLVLIRGRQVMQGYYNNPQATAKAIDPEGWFDSGDLGWVTDENDLVLTGRAKDTIVLTSGENIEPQPIEDACIRSPYIDQIMVVGQDQRSLGALVVPNLDALQLWATQQNLSLNLPDQPASTNPSGATAIALDDKRIQDLFRQELNREVQNRPGYRPDDRVGPFRLIVEPFSVENGMMTQTLKIRRPVVMERYQGMIDGMFA